MLASLVNGTIEYRTPLTSATVTSATVRRTALSDHSVHKPEPRLYSGLQMQASSYQRLQVLGQRGLRYGCIRSERLLNSLQKSHWC